MVAVAKLTANRLTSEEAAWFAGLFDGEGTIVEPHLSNPNRKNKGLRIAITNTHLPLLWKVQEVAGCGQIIEQGKPTSSRHAQAYQWATYSDNARSLLEQMEPWLIVKRERAAQFTFKAIFA
jgi:hypothetical protein